jgi:hypothetical protein
MNTKIGWIMALTLLGVIGFTSTGFAAIEIGVGMMAPGLDEGSLGALTLAPRLALGLDGFGISLDAWISPDIGLAVLMPYLQLSLHTLGFRLYAGAAPIILASSEGFTPISPALGFATKAGGAAFILGLFRIYGEFVFGISPIAQNPFTSTSLVVGIGVGL